MATSGSFNSGENAPLQCTAMSKRSRERCKGPAVLGSTTQKCRMHGGHQSTRPNMASLKTGRHSKFLPANMAKLYEEAINNPELIEMGDNIALMDARIQDLLSRNLEGDPVPVWNDLREIVNSIITDVLSEKREDAIAACERLNNLMEAGARWDATWVQVSQTMENLRKLTDTEVKRKKELNQMVPIERVVILMAAVGTAVRRNVKDPDEVAAVYRELAMLHGSDKVPGNKEGLMRVEPNSNFIDVPPMRKGVKHTMTRAAKKRAAAKLLTEIEQAEIEAVVDGTT